MTLNVLLSEKNPLLKQVRRAIARGSLTEDGFAVSESFHLLEEALASDCEIGVVIVAESGKAQFQRTSKGLKRTRVATVSDAAFAELASTEASQGVIALVRPPAWTLDQTSSRAIAAGGARRRPGPRQCRRYPARGRGIRRDRRRLPQGNCEPVQSEVPARLGGLGLSCTAGDVAR